MMNSTDKVYVSDASFNPSMEEVSFGSTHGQETNVRKTENEKLTIQELEARILKDSELLKKLKEERDKREMISSLEKLKSKNLSRSHDNILRNMLMMMETSNIKGFVYGIIPDKGKPMTGCSDNLRGWWKGKINFDRSGPAAIDKYEEENGKAYTYPGLLFPPNNASGPAYEVSRLDSVLDGNDRYDEPLSEENGEGGYNIMEGNNSQLQPSQNANTTPQLPMNENVQDINYVVTPSNATTTTSNKRKREHYNFSGFSDRNVMRSNHQLTSCDKHPSNHVAMIGGLKDQFDNNNISALSHGEPSHIAVAPIANQTTPLPIVSDSALAIPDNGEEMVPATTPTRSSASLTSLKQNILDSLHDDATSGYPYNGFTILDDVFEW
ncbi:hypothetical protein RIF29_25304 [Crotalaria pallida]|uniref:Ethylene insensitive 3-like DNA-binding domain-containing protein n=1 Tax=Crotalaria pallida TaxID=3830 RepID=A0AAN9I433_CROPI